MHIHIGNLIREELRRQRHTNQWLAEQLDINPRTVNKLFLKPSIDTQLLLRVCRVMQYDFFRVYSSSLPDVGNCPHRAESE